MEGVVIDRFGKWIKIRTQDGETILKVRKRPPEVGEIVRITDQPTSQKVYLAERLFNAPEPLPPLEELKPLLQNIGKPLNDYDIPFLVKLIEQIERRLGQLPKWFFEELGAYYKNGETSEKMEAFGLWVLTVSHPYVFRSLVGDGGLHHLFIDRKRMTFRIHCIKQSKTLCIDGIVLADSITVKVNDYKLNFEQIQSLRELLSKHFRNVFINTGGLKDGLYA
ncbi:hypothetical protein ACSFC1_05775 [Pseudothermotoga sp. U03pept]|uniref:hypothetical protein n=1 Tax=Pseudothermotoga sp. U03pept TaxID=3447012 RepID=UPI003F07C839